MRLPTRVRPGSACTPPRARAGGACTLLLILGGCSGGAHHSSATSGARPRPPAQQKAPLTGDRARAYARAVVLTAADLPGFSPYDQRRGETRTEQQLDVKLRRCAGTVGPAPGLLAQESRAYQVRRNLLDLTVSSEVGVARTPQIAADELAAARSARVRDCFSRYLQMLLQATHRGGASVGSVKIVGGTPPAPGATGSFGWRITATFGVGRLRLPLYVDILGFVMGPARVTLVSSGVVRPFPAAIQQRLYALLLERAGAQTL